MTPTEFQQQKGKRKLALLTCYDYWFARALDGQVDALLVGDSVEMALYGKPDTKQATMQKMLEHTNAVARGAPSTLVIGDMPINTYENTIDAMKNASAFIQAGAKAVKLEGPKTEELRAIAASGIPAMGHIGLLPQTAQEFKVQGRELEQAEKIIRDATALADAGAFAIVLEAIPTQLAKKITESIPVPTIGIGAGQFCDGQILVSYDALGLYQNPPKFAKRYASLSEEIAAAAQRYANEVAEGTFPNEQYSYQ